MILEFLPAERIFFGGGGAPKSAGGTFSVVGRRFLINLFSPARGEGAEFYYFGIRARQKRAPPPILVPPADFGATHRRKNRNFARISCDVRAMRTKWPLFGENGHFWSKNGHFRAVWPKIETLHAFLAKFAQCAQKMATFGRKMATFGAKMDIFGYFWPKIETFHAFLAKFAQCAQNGHFWSKNGHYWSKNGHFWAFLPKK